MKKMRNKRQLTRINIRIPITVSFIIGISIVGIILAVIFIPWEGETDIDKIDTDQPEYTFINVFPTAYIPDVLVDNLAGWDAVGTNSMWKAAPDYENASKNMIYADVDPSMSTYNSYNSPYFNIEDPELRSIYISYTFEYDFDTYVEDNPPTKYGTRCGLYIACISPVIDHPAAQLSYIGLVGNRFVFYPDVATTFIGNVAKWNVTVLVEGGIITAKIVETISGYTVQHKTKIPLEYDYIVGIALYSLRFDGEVYIRDLVIYTIT